MQQIAKFWLNSLWGKFGQRSGMYSFEYYGENDQRRFTQKILDSRYKIKRMGNYKS
jgi:hypothetical protein